MIIQDIKIFLWRLIVRLIYLTPIGHFLSLLALLFVKKGEGVNLQMNKYSVISASSKENPTPEERINWFINGLALFAESYFLIKYCSIKDGQIMSDIVGIFILIFPVLGLVNLVAAVFPKAKFDKELVSERYFSIFGIRVFSKSMIYAVLIISGFLIISTLIIWIIYNQ